ncbi:hypothetical protein [Mycobacterium nebraskense]|uniref:hypothetical protein n=1 Tax=Mycobacterium nebraskense TaxID=244292 RepID=UPI0009E4E49A|nr:hypothetical protein [Mycobacterium nebraskense]MBI2696968.1 hypothetical protein [Mycobacterium nebraskense]MCV7118036.1 hypothetical protein [Mycobacterium nebraskense]
MVGNQPWGPDVGPAAQPPAGNWPPNYLGQPASRPRPWLAVAVALTAAVAIAALIVALARPTATSPSTTVTAPTPGPGEIAAAQQQLCDVYKLAAQAAQVDTAGTDKALARIATTNGALLLEMAAANPVLDAKHRDAAQALAMAYGTLTAKGSAGVATDAEYQAALNDAVAKDAAMKKVCSGG